MKSANDCKLVLVRICPMKIDHVCYKFDYKFMGFQTFLNDPRQTPNMKMVVESGIKDSRSQKRPKSSTIDDDIESVLH